MKQTIYNYSTKPEGLLWRCIAKCNTQEEGIETAIVVMQIIREHGEHDARLSFENYLEANFEGFDWVVTIEQVKE